MFFFTKQAVLMRSNVLSLPFSKGSWAKPSDWGYADSGVNYAKKGNPGQAVRSGKGWSMIKRSLTCRRCCTCTEKCPDLKEKINQLLSKTLNLGNFFWVGGRGPLLPRFHNKQQKIFHLQQYNRDRVGELSFSNRLKWLLGDKWVNEN
jgi:hypothetical protein